MTRGIADVLEIIVLAARSHAALARWRALVVALLLAEEHVLELHHAGVGEQQRRIVPGHERSDGTTCVAVLPGRTREKRAGPRSRSCRSVVTLKLRHVSVAVVEVGPKGSADMIGGKATVLQKSRLARLLRQAPAARRRSGGDAPRAPAAPVRLARHAPAPIDQLRADAHGRELAADAQRTLAARARDNARNYRHSAHRRASGARVSVSISCCDHPAAQAALPASRLSSSRAKVAARQQRKAAASSAAAHPWVSGRRSPRRSFPQLGTLLGGSSLARICSSISRGDLGVLLQEHARVFLALADALAVVAVPGAGFLDDAVGARRAR